MFESGRFICEMTDSLYAGMLIAAVSWLLAQIASSINCTCPL
jgi:hypothetical protein